MSRNLKKFIFAMFILANNAFAEVECNPQAQVGIDNIKPLIIQKQDKSSVSKTTLIKNTKTTKYDTGYFGVLKLLIPAGFR